MRLFIAVKLSPGITQELFTCIETLKKADSSTKWVKSENIHLTLKFLGETPSELEPVLSSHLQKAALLTPLFDFRIAKLGAFPSTRTPKLVWAGITEGSGYLIKLAGLIDETFAGIGYKREEKPFTPHITLGRLSSAKKLEALRKTIEQYEFMEAVQTVKSIHLMRSELTKAGPIYTSLSESRLV